MRTRSVTLALALTAASPAMALDGQVGVGLTFDHRGVRPFAGMDGGASSRSGVYDGAWISGPGGAGAGASAGSAAGAAGAPTLGGSAGGSLGGSLGGSVGGALGGVGGAVGGAGGLTLR